MTEAAHLLEGLDEEQRLAVTTEALPLAIIAPAGSGKTRALTHRIAWRCATGRDDARFVVAVTFTRAAAGELHQRLRHLGLRENVRAGTIHALARSIIVRDHGAPSLVADPLPLLRDAGGEHLAFELRDELAWARARLVGPDGYEEAAAAAGRRTKAKPERLAAAMRAYATAKRNARVLDFDDLLEHVIERKDGPAGAGDRHVHRHLYVDEFQDVSPLQVRFLRAVADTTRLCVVGDPNQAIYGFNGADPRFLRSFPDEFAGAEVVELRRTYRSTPAIIEAASRTLRSFGQMGELKVQREATSSIPTITRCEDPAVEASRVARAIVDGRVPGRGWSEQAVLVRTRAQLAPLAEALATHHVPHQVLGDDAESPALRQAVWRLRTSRRPFRETLADLAASRDPDDEVARADDDVLELLLAAADDYERTGGRPTTDGFVAWLSLAGLAPAGPDAVTLATFHGAKGLEWSVVHVAGAEEGLLPGWWADTAETEAEERRLFYVACTRARDELHLTWAARRESGGRDRPRTRSRYLDDLSRTLEDVRRLHAPVDGSTGRGEIAAIRRSLRARLR